MAELDRFLEYDLPPGITIDGDEPIPLPEALCAAPLRRQPAAAALQHDCRSRPSESTSSSGERHRAAVSSLKPVGLLTGKRRRTALLDDAFEYEARGDVDKGVRPGDSATLQACCDSATLQWPHSAARMRQGVGSAGAFEAALLSLTAA